MLIIAGASERTVDMTTIDLLRLAESQQTSVVSQNLLKKKLDEKYESDIEINDDSDW